MEDDKERMLRLFTFGFSHWQARFIMKCLEKSPEPVTFDEIRAIGGAQGIGTIRTKIYRVEYHITRHFRVSPVYGSLFKSNYGIGYYIEEPDANSLRSAIDDGAR